MPARDLASWFISTTPWGSSLSEELMSLPVWPLAESRISESKVSVTGPLPFAPLGTAVACSLKTSTEGIVRVLRGCRRCQRLCIATCGREQKNNVVFWYRQRSWELLVWSIESGLDCRRRTQVLDKISSCGGATKMGDWLTENAGQPLLTSQRHAKSSFI